ncbi:MULTISPECIES: DUF4129 domain-containing protein [Pseudomonas]|jgi:hypothetical protein|uniref:DUF4129 domain-containing protein n=2 Tax=Pseudomonas TaxID=286 RepID=A0A4Y9TJL8_PSEFL|nr:MULTISPECIES: DUF4129 domain-containing protein [Pseudomonas]CRM96486.1 hypothetical protein [Pseudomonas sp. 22 E 5]MCX9152706.1 DUF4129 domain-containing protein [Pseudomonas sp. TB1-B1]QXH66438.1 DUF4129 domain-containing protein [Pseudomonas asgharzadehiana]TFW43212.1 DUF4129 domain-containing protein [Pseudomonas fluorescens]CRM13287.1 hypothetical protein [Pseudomonas sp. 31 E 5]
MRLSDSSVVIRPRTAWEAMDLGVLMAREHRRLLMGSWALVSLPVFAVLSALLWKYPSTAMFLFWWFKPAFDRLPLYILSKALFGETPSLKQAVRQWPRLLKGQLLASLTWRRLSLSRSFVMPVSQLEGLDGQARQKRLGVLQQRNAGAARWLTTVGVHLEIGLWFGCMALFYLFIPQQLELDWDWQRLALATTTEGLWLEHLGNAFYALILVFWEPIYVACGFSLYLNRRTVLEAWDLELVFRRLRQRLSHVATLLLLVIGLTLLPFNPPVMAGEAKPLSTQDARRSIKSMLEKPPFKNPETVTRYRFGEEKPAAKNKTHADSKLPGWLQTLLGNLNSNAFKHIAQGLEVLLWSLLAGGLALLVWRYRDWLQTFVSRRGPPSAKATPPLPTQLFGLELGTDTLPVDIASTAEQLWPTQPREALGLLYRGLLSRLLHDFNLPLKSADTEGQVLARVQQLQQPQLLAFSDELTRHWQNLAYGHHLPSASTQQKLCSDWRALFSYGGHQ